jgi:DNA-binding MarR family transcriptional regulator
METKGGPEVDALASELRLAVTRTARRLRREAGGPLSPTLTAALATIANHGPLKVSALAEREGFARPTATKVVARLEEAGFVVRANDAADGRSFQIGVSDEGERVLAEIRARKDSYLAERLEGLGVRDRETLARAARLLEQVLAG